MNRPIRTTTAAILVACVLIGCQPTPKNEGEKAEVAANAQAAMVTFKTKDPSLQSLIDKSAGYAIFPDVGKGGWIIGGSYGRGEVYEGGRKIGYADITGVSAGFQWGAQNFSEMLIFMRPADLDKFKGGEFTAGANVSAVAASAGAAAAADVQKGVIAVVDTKGGLMAEAAIGGQRIRFTPTP